MAQSVLAGERFGGARTTPLVSISEMETAWDQAPSEIRDAIRAAVTNVELFHVAQRPTNLTVEPTPGVRIDRIWSPLRSVGAYVPGGTAAYPSSMIMTVAPARAAGVSRIVVASPAGPDGVLDPTLLATAHYLGVAELYAMGGAQAIAALAYGTSRSTGSTRSSAPVTPTLRQPSWPSSANVPLICPPDRVRCWS